MALTGGQFSLVTRPVREVISQKRSRIAIRSSPDRRPSIGQSPARMPKPSMNTLDGPWGSCAFGHLIPEQEPPLGGEEQQIEQIANDCKYDDPCVHLPDAEGSLHVDDKEANPAGASDHLGDDGENEPKRDAEPDACEDEWS